MTSKKTTLKYKAFTMAEAVLVMTILGIIATVMITTMKPAQFKERALKVKTTKVINDIDQATEMILMNDSKDGTMLHLVADDGSEFSVCNPMNKVNSDKLAALYKKYLQTSRQQCIDESCSCYKNTMSNEKKSFFYLKDGACVGIYTLPKTDRGDVVFPGEYDTCKGKNCYLKDVCGGIKVDINGENEPNVHYKDMFLLRFNDAGIAWDNEVVGNEESVEDDD